MQRAKTLLLIGALSCGLAACGEGGDASVDSGPTDAGFDGGEQPADERDAQSSDAALESDASDGMRRVTIRFQAKVGAADMLCGKSYPGLGSSGISATPVDFRFFVQDLRLIRKDGTEQRVELEVRPPFQRAEVGLIDFTDRTDLCSISPGAVNTTLTGRVPEGDYEGIAFVNGVPEELNHAGPAESAGPPLDDFTLFWGWLMGYRFIVAELWPEPPPASSSPDGGAQADAGADAGSAARDASAADAGDAGDGGATSDASMSGSSAPSIASVHVGSSACAGTQGGGFSCAHKARNEIRLMGFDPSRNVVIADLAEVFAPTDLRAPVQCHGVAPPCAAPYRALGIDMDTGEKTSTQRVFRVQ